MDTSKRNIKMCEEAKKLQEEWQPSDWDYVYCKRERVFVVLSGYVTDGGCYGHETPSKDRLSYYSGSCDDLSQGKSYKEFHIWLPRQDQLQKMVGCNKNIQMAHHRLYQIAEFWIGRDLRNMEQLWLAFVMKEKFGKEWKDGTWKKVS